MVVAIVKFWLVEDARKVKRLEEDVVAVTPLMIVVITPPLAASKEEVMILVEVERPLMMEVRVLTADERELELRKLAVVVAVLPLMILVRVKELVEVDTVSVLLVEDATKLVRSVEVATPLMVVVRVVPFVERALEEITEVVAVRPLIVVERVFPVTPWVKELMIEARVEETPLMTVWKRLAEEEAVEEVMMLVVPTDPPRLEERVLPEVERVFEVVRLVIVALVVVLLPTMRLVILAKVESKLAKKPLVEVVLVMFELVL